jgi:GT2 family glycosyltransferase
MTTVGCVVLTMGTRPESLSRAVESVLAQQGVDVDVVVVGNGWTPTGLPPRVRPVALPDNLGTAAGRNAGVPHVSGEFLLFLDDDAALAGPDFLARATGLMSSDTSIGVVQPRPIDPVTGETPRSFVPRLRVGDPARSSDLAALWEGAVVMRRVAFERNGGWPEQYGYQHEGIEVAWRTIDAGYRVRYAGDLHAFHDAVVPGRIPTYYRLQGRNRVWLSRRNLPVPLAVAYVLTWMVITLARARNMEVARQSVRGWLDGLREPCGDRRRISWSAVWRMTRAGRPPVI